MSIRLAHEVDGQNCENTGNDFAFNIFAFTQNQNSKQATTPLGHEYTNVYEHRAIDPKIIDIKHDTYIYGDVFAYYYHYQGELFGVEIHNAEIAKTEKQMFEILWKMAK